MNKKNKVQKLIGIPGFKNSDDMFGVTGNYMEFASTFGDVRIIMPHEEYVEVDLLLLPGGMDLAPNAYGRIPGYKAGNHDVFKEFFFRERLKNYVGNTPIFGICLGFQMLNVYFGGTLTQNIKFHPTSPNRWQKAHKVYFDKKNEKGEIVEFDVNSHHHQAILRGDLSKELESLVHSYDDYNKRITEAFIHNTLPIGGVQWHPEEWYDDFSTSLIKHLLSVGRTEVVTEPAKAEPEIN